MVKNVFRRNWRWDTLLLIQIIFLVDKNLLKVSKIKWCYDCLFSRCFIDYKYDFVEWISLSALHWVAYLSIFLYQGKFCCMEDIAYVISWETFISLRIENIPIKQKFIQKLAKYCWSSLIYFSNILLTCQLGISYYNKREPPPKILLSVTISVDKNLLKAS